MPDQRFDFLGAHENRLSGWIERPQSTPGDSAADIHDAPRTSLAAGHPKSFVPLDDAGHLLTRGADSGYAASVIAAWATRYLPALIEDIPDISCWARKSSSMAASRNSETFNRSVGIACRTCFGDGP